MAESVDLLGPIEKGANLFIQGTRLGLVKQELDLKAQEMMLEFQRARQVQAYQSRALALQEAQENRLTEQFTLDRDLANRQSRVWDTITQAETNLRQQAPFGPQTPEADDEIRRRAFVEGLTRSGYAPQAVSIMGQESAEARARTSAETRLQIAETKLQAIEKDPWNALTPGQLVDLGDGTQGVVVGRGRIKPLEKQLSPADAIKAVPAEVPGYYVTASGKWIRADTLALLMSGQLGQVPSAPTAPSPTTPKRSGQTGKYKWSQ